MNTEEYLKLIEYVRKNHRFAKNGRHIKYIDTTVDIRDGEIFSVNFRMFGNAEKHFRIYSKECIDDIYKWLDEIYE